MTKITPSGKPGPIFVGGMFKSGTSLLRVLLGQHPAIASGLESYWFDIDWGDHENDDFTRRIQTLARLYGFPEDQIFDLCDRADSIQEFLDAFMSRFAAQEGKPRWAEKTPGNITHAKRILDLWPEARLIHIVRDPRDIYASLVEAKKWDDAKAFGSRWCAMIGAAEAFKAERPDDPRFMEVRYESLTLDPFTVMRDVMTFVGEPWDDSVAQYGGRSEDYDRVLAVTGKASTTLERLKEPLSSGRVRLWPRVLSPTQIEEIHAEAHAAGLEETMIKIETETDTILGVTKEIDA
jgi:hypothetical protein